MKNKESSLRGEKFGRWTVIGDAFVIERKERKWLCRCDCGTERYVLERGLLYGGSRSCGFQKEEHNWKLAGYLTHISGTSLEILKSQKLWANNSTGARGVYFIRGRYVAKVFFQKKAYYLGSFKNYDDAVKARKKADDILREEIISYFEKWSAKVASDQKWAKANPINIKARKQNDEILIGILLVLD